MDMFGKLEDLHELLDEETNATIFYEQINNEDEDYTSPKLDHFSELYDAYTDVMSDDSLSQDAMSEVTNQFTQICTHIINYINTEFNTDIEIDSLMDHSNNVPGIAKALYSFFVIDFYENILSIMKNYINANSVALYDEFSELNQKKDVMTQYYKKSMSPEMSVIASNIYDITDYIFTRLDGDTALKYCDVDNLPAQAIRKLIADNSINDEFITTIADIYKNNINLRSRICFEIVFAITTGEIQDPYKMHDDEE